MVEPSRDTGRITREKMKTKCQNCGDPGACRNGQESRLDEIADLAADAGATGAGGKACGGEASRRLEGTPEGDKGNGEKAKGGFHEGPQVGQVQVGNN